MIHLTGNDKAHFAQQGYLVIPNAIPPNLCQGLVKLIEGFLEVDLHDASTWYNKELGRNGIVPVHQHQAVWNTRQHPNIHAVFSQLLGTEKLWVRLDRLSFKPPSKEVSPTGGSNYIHVDSPPAQLTRLRLQGILYLTDTEENQGAFCCVPSLFKEESLLKEKNNLWFSEDELQGHDVINVPGAAGTLIVWSSMLPHSGAVNTAGKPRMAQYLSMFPEGVEEDRESRVELWKNNRAPKRWRGLPFQQDPEPGEPAKLTELGRKLLGLDEW